MVREDWISISLYLALAFLKCYQGSDIDSHCCVVMSDSPWWHLTYFIQSFTGPDLFRVELELIGQIRGLPPTASLHNDVCWKYFKAWKGNIPGWNIFARSQDKLSSHQHGSRSLTASCGLWVSVSFWNQYLQSWKYINVSFICNWTLIISWHDPIFFFACDKLSFRKDS